MRKQYFVKHTWLIVLQKVKCTGRRSPDCHGNACTVTGMPGTMIAETTETRWFWATDNLPDLCKWLAASE
jgi:hypothetical protein